MSVVEFRPRADLTPEELYDEAWTAGRESGMHEVAARLLRSLPARPRQDTIFGVLADMSAEEYAVVVERVRIGRAARARMSLNDGPGA